MVYCKLGYIPLAPLLILSRRECILQIGTVHASIVEVIFHFCQLVLLGDKGRVCASSTRSCQTVYGGRTSFRLAGKLQVKLSSFQFKK